MYRLISFMMSSQGDGQAGDAPPVEPLPLLPPGPLPGPDGEEGGVVVAIEDILQSSHLPAAISSR
jgi:hypothetical protein